MLLEIIQSAPDDALGSLESISLKVKNGKTTSWEAPEPTAAQNAAADDLVEQLSSKSKFSTEEKELIEKTYDSTAKLVG